MLSRLALRNTQALPTVACAVQNSSSATSSLYQRRKRLIDPSPVRYGFIPEEWFTFFYPKTGVTGPYVFGGGLATYLLSKEIYILEHEFFNSLSLLLISVVMIKKFGPSLKQYLDKEVKDVEEHYTGNRTAQLQSLEDSIQEQNKEKERSALQFLILDIKRENIKMQLEAAYRERLNKVYSEVKKRLDYQLQLATIERRIAHKHMVQWVISNVLKAITPDQEKANLQQCIKDLDALSQKA
ncbi:ATP synthase subunit b, mitochondrial [Prorops nasuta]|uniref:ATP synthase subunit b, mitochondrial n=1 Tax=Prorops nasuta TaxID=863751 RepID=UPI0034CF9939